MNDQNNLKRMSRRDLLEILVLQSKKIDKLEEELTKTKELLETKQIMISESGSIAEASLKLNKVFEVAQEAANQYLDNIKMMQVAEEKALLKLEKKLEKKKTSNKKKKNIKVKKQSINN